MGKKGAVYIYNICDVIQFSNNKYIIKQNDSMRFDSMQILCKYLFSIQN